MMSLSIFILELFSLFTFLKLKFYNKIKSGDDALFFSINFNQYGNGVKKRQYVNKYVLFKKTIREH